MESVSNTNEKNESMCANKIRKGIMKTKERKNCKYA
jgi:hypothetical protein